MILQNIEITRGDDEDFLISFFQDDFEETPIPVSGFADVRFAIRTTWATTQTNDTDALYVASLASGLSVYGESTLLLEIPDAVTQALAVDVSAPFVYDVQVLTSGGKRNTTQRGYIQIAPDVTRN